MEIRDKEVSCKETSSEKTWIEKQIRTFGSYNTVEYFWETKAVTAKHTCDYASNITEKKKKNYPSVALNSLKGVSGNFRCYEENYHT